MIAHIHGRIINKTLESVVVDVGGVGYEIFVPLSTYYNLPDIHHSVHLNVYTHLRENAINLYGFSTELEKTLFQMLIGVSGVGPRLARNILSGISADDLAGALSSRDSARLKSIPGVGSRTAERLAVELKDKVKDLQGVAAGKGDGRDGIFGDILSALVNLGYRPQQADTALEEVRKTCMEGDGFELLFKRALKILSKR